MFARKPNVFFLIFLVFYITPSALADDYILKDAENFAELFTKNSNLSNEDIQKKYLNIGTKGINIFMPGRIKNAKNLASEINNNRADYEKAINICLPAAKKLNAPVNDVLSKVKNLLARDDTATVYILFGANNSGGTATENGLSLGLEVLCLFAETEDEVSDVLLGFIAHEVVHVYQSRSAIHLYSRVMAKENPTLLKRSLVEGVADFVSFLILEKITNQEVVRHEHGLKHESEIWLSFKKTMHSTKLDGWLYGSDKSKPNDMGYWIGKRIAESYYNNASNKTRALKELLLLEDPKSILLNSGYNPEKA